MSIDELVAQLLEIKERNREPEVPDFDPGAMDVQVESEEGTFSSKIRSVEAANGPWLIVEEPNYAPVD